MRKARSALVVSAALLALAGLSGLASAGSAPYVGYGPDGVHRSTVAQGADVRYTVTLFLQPADGKSTVDLKVALDDQSKRDPGSFAPSTVVEFRPLSSTTYETLGTIAGYDQSLDKRGIPAAANGTQFSVRVTSTVAATTGVGDHTSYLGFTVLDPGIKASTATVAYDYTFHVTIGPPVAKLAKMGVEGFVATFDASASFDPDGHAITGYAWTFGDGSNGNGAVVTHTYPSVPDPGQYEVRLVVRNADGDTGTSTFTVSVSSKTHLERDFTGTGCDPTCSSGAAGHAPPGKTGKTPALDAPFVALAVLGLAVVARRSR